MATDYQPPRSTDLPRLIITIIVVGCLAVLALVAINFING